MKESEETMEALNRGFDDAANGRVHSLDDVLREIDQDALQRVSDQMTRLMGAMRNMTEELGRVLLRMKEALQSFNPRSGVDAQRSPYDISKKR